MSKELLEMVNTARAYDHLRKTPRKDREYWDGWYANITMAIYDEMRRQNKPIPHENCAKVADAVMEVIFPKNI